MTRLSSSPRLAIALIATLLASLGLGRFVAGSIASNEDKGVLADLISRAPRLSPLCWLPTFLMTRLSSSPRLAIDKQRFDRRNRRRSLVRRYDSGSQDCRPRWRMGDRQPHPHHLAPIGVAAAPARDRQARHRSDQYHQASQSRRRLRSPGSLFCPNCP
jgi:hypothetical protein